MCRCPTRSSYVKKPNSSSDSGCNPGGTGTRKWRGLTPGLTVADAISTMACNPALSSDWPGRICRISSGSMGRAGSSGASMSDFNTLPLTSSGSGEYARNRTNRASLGSSIGSSSSIHRCRALGSVLAYLSSRWYGERATPADASLGICAGMVVTGRVILRSRSGSTVAGI